MYSELKENRHFIFSVKLKIEWANHAYQIIDGIAEGYDLPALPRGQ
jgi:hypothetical protein